MFLLWEYPCIYCLYITACFRSTVVTSKSGSSAIDYNMYVLRLNFVKLIREYYAECGPVCSVGRSQ